MSPGDADRIDSKQRQGICHRCGWTGLVNKVGRRERKRLHSGRRFGRLCDECVNDLLRRESGRRGAGETGKAKLKAVRDRDVA
jgi:hypothetical protein